MFSFGVLKKSSSVVAIGEDNRVRTKKIRGFERICHEVDVSYRIGDCRWFPLDDIFGTAALGRSSFLPSRCR